MGFRKKGTSDKVSKILLRNDIEAASTLPNSKYINVFDGIKYSHIPKTAANMKALDKKFGKPRVYDYRGKNRKTWLDHNLYE